MGPLLVIAAQSHLFLSKSRRYPQLTQKGGEKSDQAVKESGHFFTFLSGKERKGKEGTYVIAGAENGKQHGKVFSFFRALSLEQKSPSWGRGAQIEDKAKK